MACPPAPTERQGCQADPQLIRSSAIRFSTQVISASGRGGLIPRPAQRADESKIN